VLSTRNTLCASASGEGRVQLNRLQLIEGGEERRVCFGQKKRNKGV